MSRISARVLVITFTTFASLAIAAGLYWGDGSVFGIERAAAKSALPSARLMTTPLNAITSFDAAVIAWHVGGTVPFVNNNQKCAADVTNNGNISSNDSARISQYVTSRVAGGVPGTMAAPPCHANWPTTVPVVKGDVSGQDPVLTAGQGSADVGLPAITSPQGALSVPITVSDLTGMDVFSYDFQVTFDPSVLHPTGFDLTCHEAPPGGHETCYEQLGTLSNILSITANATDPGHLIISGFAAASRSGSGTLLVLKFDVVGSAGQSTALTFEDYTTSDGLAHQSFLFNEGQAAAVTTNGSVTVGPGSSTATATPTATSTATNTATPVGSPGSAPVTVSLPNVSAVEGSGITIPITAGNTTALGVISYDIQVTYDPAVLQPASPAFDRSGTLSSSMMASTWGGPGHLIVSAFQGNPISGSGTLIKLRFTVVGTAGQSSALTFEDYTDPVPSFHPAFVFNEGDPASTTTSGSVTLVAGGGEAIAGTARYGNPIGGQATRFVPDVMVDGAGSTAVWATTDSVAGNYALTGFGTGSYMVSPSKTGGLNNAIGSFDAARIAQQVVGSTVLNANQLIVADVSSNGSVSSFDAAQIAAYAAGLPGAGTTGNWRFNPASRSYSSVSTVGGEDYTALLMGEVSGNWANTGGRPVVDQASARNAKISVTAPRSAASPGSDVLVPVAIRGAVRKGIISYEFDLRYDPSVIQPLAAAADLAGTVSRGLSVVTNPIESGLLRVVVYGAMPIRSDGVLLNLRFMAVGKAGSASPLSFERIVFNEGSPRVNATGGEVELF
jgi:hypothetical protein